VAAMAHKIRIYDVNTNEEVTSQDMYFIGLNNRVYALDDCDCLVPTKNLYWKFDMIEVKDERKLYI
jgi:hypothetical protein